MTSNDELDNQATAHSIEHLIVWPMLKLSAISVFAMSLHNVHSLQVMPEKAQIAITGLFGNFASSVIHLLA